MATQLMCPTCGEAFADEEYCPVHGARLRAVSSAPAPAPAPSTAASDALAASRTPTQAQALQEPERPAGEPSSQSTEVPGVTKHSGKPSLMSRLTDRLRRTTEPAPNSGAEPRTAGLPPELTGWALVMPLIEHKSLDGSSQQVVDADQRRALYKCYSPGSLTSNNAYAQLKQLHCTGLVPLLAQGHFSGKDFELIAEDAAAKPFDEWVQCNLGDGAAVWFIRQCAEILTSLASVQLAPLWLEPSSFVVSAGTLKLIDYGKLMQVHAGGSGFLATLPASQTEYAGAEIFKTKHWHPNSPLYSVGAIAMQLAAGHAPTHHVTEHGDIDLRVIRDAGLRSAIQGLLYPDPERRWQISDLVKWTQGSPVDLPDWSRLRPGAANSAFVLHGRNIHLPGDLAEPLLQDLDLSAERLDEVIDWLNDNPAMREVSNEIAIHRRHGRSTDWLLLRLAHRLNPVCPRVWRGVSLDDAAVERNLFELARRATNGDVEAKALIDRLQQADLSGVYTVKSEVRS